MRVRPASFLVGIWVWLYSLWRYVGRSSKWQWNYSGPFLVSKVLGLVDVVVRRMARSKPQLVCIDKLKPFLREAPKRWLVDGTEPTPSEEESVFNQESSGDALLQFPDPNGDEWRAESVLVQDEEHVDAPRSVVQTAHLINQPLVLGMRPPDLCIARLENARFRHSCRRECKLDDRPVRGVDKYSHHWPGGRKMRRRWQSGRRPVGGAE